MHEYYLMKMTSWSLVHKHMTKIWNDLYSISRAQPMFCITRRLKCCNWTLNSFSLSKARWWDFSGEQVQVHGHVLVRNMLERGENYNTPNIRYLVVSTPFPYTIIIGIPTFNLLKEVIFILNLTMKYPLDNDQIRVIMGDQGITKKC